MKLLLAACLLLAGVTVALAQAPGPHAANREPFLFASGHFRLSGDLLTPDTAGPHPVIVYVWGAGPTNRQRHIDRSPVLRMFLEQGYGVLLYDKPGSGGSTGEIDPRHQFRELADALLDAIAALKARDDVDARTIGLYGSSQASYVMAVALPRTRDVAFVIGWSCPMQNSIEQGAFLVRHYVLCEDGSTTTAAAAEEAYRLRACARTYSEYRTAAEILNGIPAIRDGLGWAGPVREESEFAPADSTSESFFDPSAAFASLQIPVLALYAKNDRQIDPVQGANTLQAALADGRNPLSSVAVIADADHNMNLSPRGCMQDQYDDYRSVGGKVVSPVFIDTMRRWLVDLRAHGGE